MEKSKIVLCRPFYCPECDKLNRVIEGKLFAVYGSQHQSIFLKKSSWHSVRGITPHLIFFDGIKTDTHVELLVACSINDCGVQFYEVPDKAGEFDMSIKKVRKVQMLFSDFEALKKFNDRRYRID